MRITTRRPAAAFALVGALALSACAGDEPAQFAEPNQSEPESATAPEDPEGATPQTQPPPADDEESATEAVEPAAEQVIDVGESETVSQGDTAFTLTVHRVVVHDYYLEAEVTIVNDGDDRLETWYGSWNGYRTARIFDDRGRVYPFQVQAGGDGETLRLEPRQGLDAVLVFAGRLDPEATQVTLDFEELGRQWAELLFQVPVGGAS